MEFPTNIKTSLVSPHNAQSYFFSLKMWKIISPSDSLEYTKSRTKKLAGVDKGCFQHWNTILGTLIWVWPNLIFSKTATTVKHNSNFLSNQQRNLNIITRKFKTNVMYSLFGLLNNNFRTSLYYNPVG